MQNFIVYDIVRTYRCEVARRLVDALSNFIAFRVPCNDNNIIVSSAHEVFFK